LSNGSVIVNKQFFDVVRKNFGPLSQKQVDGINAILDALPAGTDIRHAAYDLATAWHETGERMQPIDEYGGNEYFFRMYDKNGARPHVARDLGNTQPGDGVKFHGRGFVQLTGRANYDKAGRKLGVDLVGNPELAKDQNIAAQILTLGMAEGWFTGKKVGDYFNDQVDDPVGARRVVNAQDKAELIAGYYKKWLAATEEGIKHPPSVPVIDAVVVSPTSPSSPPVGTAVGVGAGLLAAVVALLKYFGVF
jgi:putative chitinase